jgi:hypothetical protein
MILFIWPSQNRWWKASNYGKEEIVTADITGLPQVSLLPSCQLSHLHQRHGSISPAGSHSMTADLPARQVHLPDRSPSRPRRTVAKLLLCAFCPFLPYPPGQCDAFWLPSPKATTPPAIAAGIAPRHARARRAPAPCARRYNDLLPCAFANCHHVENEKELLAAKTPSTHESRAVPVRGHHSPVTYTRCGYRVTDEITGHLSSADGRQSFAPSRGSSSAR